MHMKRIVIGLNLSLSILLAPAIAAAPASVEVIDDHDTLPPSWTDAIDFRSIGPANMSGRIVALAINENDPTNYWVATASGGLLKTVNNGIDYEHQFDDQETVSIGHVAVAQSDPNIVWVGTGEANPRNSVSYGNGVYKSVDGGKTWKHMGLEESFQTGRIAIHPEDPNVVYVGALGRLYGPNEQRGMFKTTDGGENWEKVLYIDDKTGVIDVDMHPTDPETLIVATYERERDGFDTNDPAKKWGDGSGIHKTTDGGKTWTELTEGLPSVKKGRIGIDYYRKNPDVIFAIVESERIAKLAENSAAMGIVGEDAEVGAKLTQIVEGGAAEAGELKVGDIILGINEEQIASYQDLITFIRNAKPDDTVQVEFVRDREFMKAEVTFKKREGDGRVNEFNGTLGGQRENIQDQQGRDAHETGGIYRSEDGGESWTRINSLNPRPMYYSQIRVDPSDEKYVYVLGTSLYRSKDGGKTFTGDGGRGGVHVDHHALWINPDDGRHMILGNDGGVYVTHSRMDQWDHHNHVAIGQFYHVTTDATMHYNVYGGLQDNGSWGGPSRTRTSTGPVNSDWINVGGGDGFVCRVDEHDPELIYFESQNGGMGRVHLGTGERGFIRPRAPRGVRYRFNWKTPFILSHHNSKIYYTAGNHVFRSLDRGNNLKVISPDITHTDRGSGTALAESPRDSDVMYVGSDDGALWMTKDGGQTWVDLFDPEKKKETDVEESEQPADRPADDRAAAMLQQLLARFDDNSDGKLQKSETPDRLHGFFERMDADSNGVIEGDEIKQTAEAESSDEQTSEKAEDEKEREDAPATSDLVSGKWVGTATGDDIPKDASEFVVELSRDEAGTIRGSFKAEAMDGEVSKATFDEKSGELNVTFAYDNKEFILIGKIEKSKMTGELQVAGGLLTVPFEAMREGGQQGKDAAAASKSDEAEATADSEAADEEPARQNEPADAEDIITGKWEGELISEELPPGTGEFSMELKLGDDGKITGTLSSDQGDVEITEGKFDADKKQIRLTMALDQADVVMEAKVEGREMTGDVDMGGGMFQAGFKAKRVKLPANQSRDRKGADETPVVKLNTLASTNQTRTTLRNQAFDALIATITMPGSTPGNFYTFTLASSADAVTGKWSCELQSDQMPPGAGEFSLELELTHDNKIKGEFLSQFADATLESGTFNPDDGKFKMSFTTEMGTATIEGKFADDKLEGELVGGGGQFTMGVTGKRTEKPEAAADEPAADAPKTDDSDNKASTENAKPASGPIADLLPKRLWVSSLEASKFEDGRVYVTFDGHRSDNDDPHAYVSEDFGKTWTSLNADLPRGSTRVIREDLENPNLLYLGTEFGLYVSIDRGKTWSTFEDFPTVAVHEVAQHPTMGEIVVGTHGRSLWVADVRPLRQLTEGAMSAPAYLYESGPAILWQRQTTRGSSGLRRFVGENPPSGVQIYYSLAKKADNLSLVIEDMAGNTLRELSTANDAGLHRVIWDLRTIGNNQRGRRGRGALARTGTYRVVLTVGGERYSHTVEVVADPDYPQSRRALEQLEAYESGLESLEDDDD